jgi:hypothetical protein
VGVRQSTIINRIGAELLDRATQQDILSPMAYKSIENIVSHIAPTADIELRIKPAYNFKAGE